MLRGNAATRLDDFTASLIVGGEMSPSSEAERREAWQRMVSSGEVWRMPSRLSKTAEAMIASEEIHR